MGSGPGMLRQVKLTVFQNEALARLAEQRLGQERILCVVRSLGAGPGGWGVATNLPHALYVLAEEEMLAREVLNIPPAEIAERETRPVPPLQVPTLTLVGLLVIAAAVLILGVQIVYTRILS